MSMARDSDGNSPMPTATGASAGATRAAVKSRMSNIARGEMARWTKAADARYHRSQGEEGRLRSSVRAGLGGRK